MIIIKKLVPISKTNGRRLSGAAAKSAAAKVQQDLEVIRAQAAGTVVEVKVLAVPTSTPTRRPPTAKIKEYYNFLCRGCGLIRSEKGAKDYSDPRIKGGTRCFLCKDGADLWLARLGPLASTTKAKN